MEVFRKNLENANILWIFPHYETVFRLELTKISDSVEVAVKRALKCIAWYYCVAGSSSTTQTQTPCSKPKEHFYYQNY